MKLSKEEKRKWIEPIVIDTKEKAEALVQAFERAAAAPMKDIAIDYKEITDKEEIKELFKNI